MFFAATANPHRHHGYAAPDAVLQRFLEASLRTPSAPSAPSNRQYAQDDAGFTLTLDMPGIAKDQLNITIDKTLVQLQSKEGAARKYHKTYEFPLEIDPQTSQAKLEHGVLTLTLAKKAPVSSAHTLRVD